MGLTDRFAERYFTWGVSLSYLAGFASMYAQISGLQGPDGILDIDSQPRYVCPPVSRTHFTLSLRQHRSASEVRAAGTVDRGSSETFGRRALVLMCSAFWG